MRSGDGPQGFDKLRIGVLALIDKNDRESLDKDGAHQRVVLNELRTDFQDIAVPRTPSL